MPRFNPLGDYEAGVGGGDEANPVSLIVNGAVCERGPGGGGDWLTTDEVACYRYLGSLRACAIHKATGQERRLRDGSFNKVFAGGGRWATAGTDGRYVLDDGTAAPYPIVALGQYDGCLATRAHAYNNSGLIVAGQVLVPAASDEDVLAYGPNAWDIQVLDAATVVWRGRDGVHAFGLPVPQILPGRESYGLRVAPVQGRWWVCYYAADYNGCLVCHPVDSFLGYVLTAPGAPAYRPDLFADATRFLVVWSVTEREQVGELALVQPGVTPGYPLVDLTTTQPTPPKPEPVPPDPEPEPEPPEPEPEPPDPEPEPEPQPPEPEPEAPMAIYLKLGHYYTGVEPTPVPGATADAQFPVYADREAGGAWEEVILTRHDDGAYDALYVAANRTLSIQPDGTLQTRPGGTYGGYEAVCATTQPDGASILYRRDADIVIPCNVLTIEDRS